jgi:two-component sensor histidine kinase
MMVAKDPNDLDATRIRALRRGLDQRHLAVQHQSTDLVYTLSENLPDDWESADAMDPEVADRIRLMGKAVLEGSNSATTEVEHYRRGTRRIHEVTCTPDRLPDGTIDGVITIIADVTEARERERAIANLLREVSHRSKNLLAIVLSIAAQTANHAGSIDDFLEKFRGRIQALASTQDLVTESNWLGTPFQSLVLAQLARGGQTTPEGVSLSGDNPTLGPNAALHVGLAIHELVTNATLYGALSVDNPGDIRVAATLEHINDRLQLVIDWREKLLLDHPAPTPPHFGTIVLEQIVPHSLGGKAEFDVGEDRVRYRLVVPGDQFIV